MVKPRTGRENRTQGAAFTGNAQRRRRHLEVGCPPWLSESGNRHPGTETTNGGGLCPPSGRPASLHVLRRKAAISSWRRKWGVLVDTSGHVDHPSGERHRTHNTFEAAATFLSLQRKLFVAPLNLILASCVNRKIGSRSLRSRTTTGPLSRVFWFWSPLICTLDDS